MRSENGSACHPVGTSGNTVFSPGSVNIWDPVSALLRVRAGGERTAGLVERAQIQSWSRRGAHHTVNGQLLFTVNVRCAAEADTSASTASAVAMAMGEGQKAERRAGWPPENKLGSTPRHGERPARDQNDLARGVSSSAAGTWLQQGAPP